MMKQTINQIMKQTKNLKNNETNKQYKNKRQVHDGPIASPSSADLLENIVFLQMAVKFKWQIT